MHDGTVSVDGAQRKDLWRRFVNGDEACFKQLFKRYYKEMLGYGMKLCGKSDVVKDCIQELFETVWKRRDELDHVDSPNVYLFVSLRRKILQKIKKHRKRKGDWKEVDEEALIYFGIEDIIITDETKFQQKKALKNALNQLSTRQKEVVFLHYYNGLSYGEIQQILSINRQSVRNHIYRAMETLRTILDNEIMKLVISLMITFLFSLPSYL